MQLKRLREAQDTLVWAPDSNELPVVDWESCTLHSSYFIGSLSDTPTQSKSKLQNVLSF